MCISVVEFIVYVKALNVNNDMQEITLVNCQSFNNICMIIVIIKMYVPEVDDLIRGAC